MFSVFDFGFGFMPKIETTKKGFKFQRLDCRFWSSVRTNVQCT